MTKKVKCCHLEGGRADGKACEKDAEWAITGPGDPEGLDTYSCSEHLAKMMSDENYVQHFPQKE